MLKKCGRIKAGFVLWLGMISVLSVVVTIGCGQLWPVIKEGAPFNFHVLEEGRAYRSGQPTPEALAVIAEKYDIRTVINLRGSNTGKTWYDEEIAACQAMGINHVDHAMSALRLPSAEELEAVIHTLHTAEYPILVHCQSGADRTGLVSVIYRMTIMGHDREEALQELSPEFFHFREFTPCMDIVAEIFEPDPAWLDEYETIMDQLVCTP